MAIQKKLIHFKSLEKFKEAVSGGQILGTSIVFIQDAKLIWTHGTYYSSVVLDYDNIVIDEDNINIQTDDSYSVAFKKIEKSIELEQRVIAAALTDLEDRISDFQFTITDDYIEVTYPTDDPNAGIDPKYIFNKVQPGDLLDIAFNKVETNISTLFEALLEDEEIISQTMTTVDTNIREFREELLGKLDTGLKISKEYVPITYPEDIDDVVFHSVQPKDSLSDAIRKLDNNISILTEEVIKDEETMVAAFLETKKYVDNKVFSAKEISGCKNVDSLSDLYTLEDHVLSPTSTNYNFDALGQVWYVIGERSDYRLIDWENRNNSNGWEKLIYNNSASSRVSAISEDIISPEQSIVCYDPAIDESQIETTSGDEELTIDEIREIALQDLYNYDHSDRINGFYLNNELVWIDKLTRMSLMYSVRIERDSGKLMSTIWINEKPYTLSCELAIALLSELELYAIECFNKTSEHRLMINSFTEIEEILDYDFMSGYPDRLSFII